MSTIQDIQSNIKLNLNYIINADDDFKVIISKIVQKLKASQVNILLEKQDFIKKVDELSTVKCFKKLI